MRLSSVFIASCMFGAALAVNNGFTKPPLGWSALYGAPFGSVNETIVQAAADGLAAGGFKAAGFEYVTLDDWYAMRNANGTIIGDPTTFPTGMKALGQYIHSKGLKFGVYSAASQRTCGNWSASLFNEQNDANTFANDWEIDYLKYDNCRYTDGIINRGRYTAMRDALNQTGRPIFYSMEGNALFPDVGNMVRSGGDIWPKWDACILRNLYSNNALAHLKTDNFFLDPDMIQASSPDLTFDEAKSQFVLWAVMKAPLILGAHYSFLATMATDMPEYFNLLTHDELIAIDQDPSPMATLRTSTPSPAQETNPAGLNVTFQDCDYTRRDQQWVAGSSPGSIQAAGGNLCLDVSASGTLFATPCVANSPSQAFSGAERDSQFHIVKAKSNGNCVQSKTGTNLLETQPCSYTGPLPPPLNENVGQEVWVWDFRHSLLTFGGNGMCATLGLPNELQPGQKYVTNNGTLEHEVWAGPLSNGKTVMVLFNKGTANSTIVGNFADADIPGGPKATLPVRDVYAKKDLGDFTGSIKATVPSHGVQVYVIG